MHASAKSSFTFALALSLGLAAAPSSAKAQGVAACSAIAALALAGDIVSAQLEYGFCGNALRELYHEGLLETLGVEILGYAPGEGTVESALGFSQLEIDHMLDGDVIGTTLTSGNTGQASPMAGLGALAGLAGTLGISQPGIQTVRLGRLSGQLEDNDDGTYTLTVTLSGGEVLTHTGTNGDLLQRFAIEAIRLVNAFLGG